MKLEDMTFEDKVSYWAGHVLMAIGAGKYREAVAEILMSGMQDAYERGEVAGIAIGRKQVLERATYP